MKHPHKFVVDEEEGHMVGRVEPLKREVTTSVKFIKKTLKVR